MHQQNNIKIKAGLALAAAVLVAIVVLAGRDTRRLMENSRWVLHSYEVQNQLNELYNQLQDLETGVRGFVITGQNDFLEPYELSRLRLDKAYQKVRHLTADNPRQQRRLTTLASLITDRIATANGYMELRRSQGLAAAAAELAKGDGKRVMDQIRRVVAALDDEEQRLLLQREGAATIDAARTLTIFTLGISLNVVLLAWIGRLIRGDNARQQQAAEILRASREYAENIVQTIAEPLLVLDAELRVCSANRAFYEAFGTTPAETENRFLHELGQAQWNRPELRQRLGEVNTQGAELKDFQFDAEFPGTGVRSLVLRARKVFRPGNHTGLILLSIADLTAHKQTELALRRSHDELDRKIQERTAELQQSHDALAASEQQLRTIIDSEPECVKLLDRAGTLLTINPAGLAMLGADSLDQLVGRCVYPLVLSHHQPAFRALVEAVFRGEPGQLEFEMSTLKGERLWMDTRQVPLRDPAHPAIIQSCLGVTRNVTQRKQAEAAVRESEERLRLAMDAAQLGDWSWDLVTGEAVWSERCKVLYGLPPETPMSYERFLAAVHPDDRERIDTTLKRAVADRTDYSVEKRVLWPDGSVHWNASRGRVFHDGAGNPVRMSGVTYDITERQQVAERIRQSEANLANAQRIAHLGSWELNLRDLDEVNRNRLRWSEEVYRIFGYQPGEIEVSNENFFRAVHPEDRSRIQAAMAQAVKHRQPYNLIHRIILPDGSERIVQEHSEIHFDEPSGQPLKMIGTVQDITALKTAEQALENSEALYHSLVEHLPLSVFRKDRQGRLTFANARFCAAVGKPLSEVLGQTDFEIAPADLARKYREDDRQVMETGEFLEKVEENRFIPGETRVIQVLKAPLRNAQGEIVGIQGIFLDVTERKELEEQLRQSQKMEAIGQLAGGVAHDFNNLLTIIQGYAQLLLTQENLPANVAEPLKQIYNAGERAADLTRQLLTFSRKQVMAPRALDLNESVRDITKMLQRIIGEDITLQCAFAPALPRVLADAGMINQILLNLSVNARDAMSKGGRLAIETSVVELDADAAWRHPEARPGRFVCLSVRDTGCGIAPEHLAHIYEPFFTTKDVGRGTGLGLATVFGIVQQHQGWMEVDSIVGTGTTFEVFLPVTADTLASAAETATKVRGGTETILVVEDEEALRYIVLIVLRNQGYRVLEAASGVKALLVWQEHAAEIDLLLTDLVMPDGVTGRELAEQLRAQKPELKLIYTSGYSPEFAGPDLTLKEGLNFLQKPYPPQKLAQTVRDCLDA